jgi:hypothetical protein
MTPEKLTRSLVEGGLKSLLVTINAFEGLDMRDSVRHAREALDHFIAGLALLDAYGYGVKPGLQTLDKVFVKAGWDNNGLRWDLAPRSYKVPRELYRIQIVEFLNKEKTAWKKA